MDTCIVLYVCSPDQWLFYREYLKSVFALVDANWKPPEVTEDNPAYVLVL